MNTRVLPIYQSFLNSELMLGHYYHKYRLIRFLCNIWKDIYYVNKLSYISLLQDIYNVIPCYHRGKVHIYDQFDFTGVSGMSRHETVSSVIEALLKAGLKADHHVTLKGKSGFVHNFDILLVGPRRKIGIVVREKAGLCLDVIAKAVDVPEVLSVLAVREIPDRDLEKLRSCKNLCIVKYRSAEDLALKILELARSYPFDFPRKRSGRSYS